MYFDLKLKLLKKYSIEVNVSHRKTLLSTSLLCASRSYFFPLLLLPLTLQKVISLSHSLTHSLTLLSLFPLFPYLFYLVSLVALISLSLPPSFPLSLSWSLSLINITRYNSCLFGLKFISSLFKLCLFIQSPNFH